MEEGSFSSCEMCPIIETESEILTFSLWMTSGTVEKIQKLSNWPPRSNIRKGH